jgi:hypothetical protein
MRVPPTMPQSDKLPEATLRPPILRRLESQLSDAAGLLLSLTFPIFVAAADSD